VKPVIVILNNEDFFFFFFFEARTNRDLSARESRDGDKKSSVTWHVQDH
jgi:hypothetical protein